MGCTYTNLLTLCDSEPFLLRKLLAQFLLSFCTAQLIIAIPPSYRNYYVLPWNKSTSKWNELSKNNKNIEWDLVLPINCWVNRGRSEVDCTKGMGLSTLNDWKTPGSVIRENSVISLEDQSYDILIKNDQVKTNFMYYLGLPPICRLSVSWREEA